MSKAPESLHAWAEALDTLRDHAWSRLTRGVHDRHAAARYPALGTVSGAGRPQVRTVVLRRVDVQSGELEIHTDRDSAKVNDLQLTPWASILVWDSSAHLQIRLECATKLLDGEAAAGTWARLPASSKAAYGRLPRTGQRIADALAFQNNEDEDSFVIVRLTVMTMDLLHLGSVQRRAVFMRDDGWVGEWRVP